MASFIYHNVIIKVIKVGYHNLTINLMSLKFKKENIIYIYENH